MFEQYKNGNGCEYFLGEYYDEYTGKYIGWLLVSLNHIRNTYDKTRFETKEDAIKYMGITAKKVGD